MTKILKEGPDEEREETTDLSDQMRRKFYKAWGRLWIPVLSDEHPLTPTMLLIMTIEPFDVIYSSVGSQQKYVASKENIGDHGGGIPLDEKEYTQVQGGGIAEYDSEGVNDRDNTTEDFCEDPGGNTVGVRK